MPRLQIQPETKWPSLVDQANDGLLCRSAEDLKEKGVISQENVTGSNSTLLPST